MDYRTPEVVCDIEAMAKVAHRHGNHVQTSPPPAPDL
jgi:hypothetical protein